MAKPPMKIVVGFHERVGGECFACNGVCSRLHASQGKR